MLAALRVNGLKSESIHFICISQAGLSLQGATNLVNGGTHLWVRDNDIKFHQNMAALIMQFGIKFGIVTAKTITKWFQKVYKFQNYF